MGLHLCPYKKMRPCGAHLRDDVTVADADWEVVTDADLEAVRVTVAEGVLLRDAVSEPLALVLVVADAEREVLNDGDDEKDVDIVADGEEVRDEVIDEVSLKRGGQRRAIAET